MRRRAPNSASSSGVLDSIEQSSSSGSRTKGRGAPWIALFVLFLYSFWAVHQFQYESLPIPQGISQAGKRGFSEESAMKHVKTLTGFGPRIVGSDALDLALQYVLETSEEVRKTANWEVDVEVDLFHPKSSANILNSGLFKGKTHLYSDTNHVVLRILPKYLPEAGENVILVSSHIDTVFSTEGAGDCSSCVGVMLELARSLSQWAHGFKSGIIFLFNTGEEEGLNGAHSFITQHRWRHTVRFFVDLESMGIGGKSVIFQSGSVPWAFETYARVAKYPNAQVFMQDLFLSGAVKSSTDFQVYSEVGGIPGLDFAYTDSNSVYHTKNDKLELLKPGSLQHLGDNMLAFLVETALSANLSSSSDVAGKDRDAHMYFDILGMYMVECSQSFANMFYNTILLQAILIWVASLSVGGFQAFTAMLLSILSVILMWTLSLSLAVPVAFLLPLICVHPAPYIGSPWLIMGLFGAPAVIGALVGQHLGFLILHKYLCHIASRGAQVSTLDVNLQYLLKLESERWIFKGGFLLWQFVLVLGIFFKVGSSYIPLLWLASPALAFGLIDATLTPARLPKKLRIITLLLGLTPPILISASIFIRFGQFIVGSIVRFDRDPGGVPYWLANLIVAIFVATIVCLLFVYLLSYIHLSGSKIVLVISMAIIFILAIIGVSFSIFPTFTDDIARTINVVHVVDTTKTYGEKHDSDSYVSIFSATPGKLDSEMKNLKSENFSCGRSQTIDFITFNVSYGCLSSKGSSGGWSKSDIPILHVESDVVEDVRKTQVLLDTKSSTRWSLAINSDHVEDFTIEANSDDSLFVKNKADGKGWHLIQFSGGKKSPTKFTLTLFWSTSIAAHASQRGELSHENSQHLLKLRTDMSTITPKAARVIKNLPSWCSLFGKSTSPLTFSFLANLPIEF